ncbi:twin-arginine translocase subunit TatC [Paenibacillus thermoaerophilus]|uniref:Sec-independent protein translocase protein TatC n=1 Tax=Paenibacillus thermoaerophilus TaxID=1215385 RepID=A0ABW2V0E1_9BACL|nr:twin-arginine translocase subunit TatC [Paenibacillus thermoaerophilus]
MAVASDSGRSRGKSADELPVLEHLGELRRRLIYCIVFLVIAMGVGLFFAGSVIEFLKTQPPAKDITWNAFAPWEPIRLYMMFAFIIGLAASLPFILWQIWLFVRPGLRPDERRATVKYIPAGVILFLLGLAFGYFVVFPMAFYFTSSVAQNLNITETYGIAQYFSFMLNILLPIALLFELPIAVMFLTRIRVLSPARLRKLRRFAYLALVIVAAFVTPPDVISDILVSVPMIALYEASVLMSAWVYRRRQAEDEAWEKRWADAEPEAAD